MNFNDISNEWELTGADSLLLSSIDISRLLFFDRLRIVARVNKLSDDSLPLLLSYIFEWKAD